MFLSCTFVVHPYKLSSELCMYVYVYKVTTLAVIGGVGHCGVKTMCCHLKCMQAMHWGMGTMESAFLTALHI